MCSIGIGNVNSSRSSLQVNPNLQNIEPTKKDELLRTKEQSIKKFKPKEKNDINVASLDDLKVIDSEFEINESALSLIKTNPKIDNELTSESLSKENNIENKELKSLSKQEEIEKDLIKEKFNSLEHIKEHREILHTINGFKNTLTTDYAKNYLEKNIKAYIEPNISDFKFGLNPNNINEFSSRVKYLTKHDGVFKTNRLIKDFYNSVDKISEVYSSGKTEKFSLAIDNAIKEAKKFIVKNPNSTRVAWVKEFIPLLEHENEQISKKIDIIKNIDSTNAENIFKDAIKNNISLAGHLDKSKIYNILIDTKNLDANKSIDFISQLAKIDKDLANDITLKAFKEKKISYFDLYSFSIQIRSDGSMSPPIYMEELKSNFNKEEIKFLNSVMKKYVQIEPNTEVDSKISIARYLSELDSETIKKINSLTLKKPKDLLEKIDINDELKKIMGKNYETFTQSKLPDSGKNIGYQTLGTLATFVFHSSLIKNFKEPNEQLQVLNSIKPKTEMGKQIFKIERDLLTININKFSQNLSSDNVDDFVDEIKELTKKDSKKLENFYTSLKSLSNVYLTNDRKKYILTFDKVINEADSFITKNTNSKSKEWINEIKSILTNLRNTKDIVLQIEDINLDIKYRDLNKLFSKAIENKIKISDFDISLLEAKFNSIDPKKDIKTPFSGFLAKIDAKILIDLLFKDFDDKKISYFDLSAILVSSLSEINSDGDHNILFEKVAKNILDNTISKRHNEVKVIDKIRKTCIESKKEVEVDYRFNINNYISLFNEEDTNKIKDLQSPINNEELKEKLGNDIYNKIINIEFGGKKNGIDVINAIVKLVNDNSFKE